MESFLVCCLGEEFGRDLRRWEKQKGLGDEELRLGGVKYKIARMRKTNLVEFDNIRNCERRRFLWIRMLLRKFRRQLSLLRSI